MKGYLVPLSLGIAAIVLVVGAFGTGTGDNTPSEGADDGVILGEVDLAEQAEIWRNQYRRMTPGDGPLVQDVGELPAAWEEFSSVWDAAPAVRDLATWLVPFSAERDGSVTVLRDADGTVLWSGTTDFAKPESADVTLTGALVAELDWPLYDAAQAELAWRRTAEAYREAGRPRLRDGEGGGTNNTPTNNPDKMFVSAIADFTTNPPEIRVGLLWTNDVTLDVFAYGPLHTSALCTITYTNDENQLVTTNVLRWYQVEPTLTGRYDNHWDYLGTVTLTNGDETVFVDTNYLPERWVVRYYSAFESGDFDNDGLNDAFETRILGTSTNSPDTDGDGIDDATEYACGAYPTISNVWWVTKTTNTLHKWIGRGTDIPTTPQFVTNYPIDGARPTTNSVALDVRITGFVDDILCVDGNVVGGWDAGPTNFVNLSVLDQTTNALSGHLDLELWDLPSPGYVGENEVKLGNSFEDPFRVEWTWWVPMEMRMQPIYSDLNLPLENPSGIILGSNAFFSVMPTALELFPIDKISWTSVYHKVEFVETNRGCQVEVCATNIGDDELRVSLEDLICDFNLPPFHVKVMPLTVVTAKVGVVCGPNGQGGVDGDAVAQAFDKANAILAQAGIQLAISQPIISIPYDEEYWDVHSQSSMYAQLLSSIPNFGGLKVYFANSLTSDAGGDADGVNTPYGMVIACGESTNGTPRDIGRTIAHETSHACGLRDLFPNVISQALYADGAISEERMPYDWGNYGLLNGEEIPIGYLMQRLLMYWRGVNYDIPSGEVFGVWYTHGATNDRIWHLSNAPVGLSGMTNFPPVHH